MNMQFKQELQMIKNDVDKEIASFLDEVIVETQKRDRFTTHVLKYFKKTILSGGKRIRPIMMYWGYCAAGGVDKKEIIKASISIELIHAFLLMHDDIIDRDNVRRGQKTIHAQYAKYHKKIFSGNDSAHFGMSIALVFGDFIYSLGNNALFKAQFDSQLIVRSLQKMQDVVGLTSIGEIQDVYMEYKKKATEKEILTMYENKTARYTFDGPMKLGAILAGASDKFCDQLSSLAIPLGIIFQLRDDMLGVFGDQKEIGKPVGSDVAEGKYTFLVSCAYKNADRAQKKILDVLLGKNDLTKRELIQFQQVVIASGAKKDVEDYINECVTRVYTEIDRIDISQESRAFILHLTQHLHHRTV